jgi:hypothetical protein
MRHNDLAFIRESGANADVTVYCGAYSAQEGGPEIQITTKRAPGNLVEDNGPEKERGWLSSTIGNGLFGYCLPVILPIGSAVTTAIAAVNHGPVRVYWSIGAVAAIAASSALGAFKEHGAKSAYKSAEQKKSELATKLADIGFPLLTALGNVTSAATLDDATAAINVLIDRSVSLAQTQLGHQTTVSCQVRATYYEFDNGKNKLLRNKYHVCAGANLPRIEFVLDKNDQDDDVIRLALREDVRFVRNLDSESLPYSTDSASRTYKTLIAVPVRAGNNSYGLLTADSDVAYSLTNADRGFLILVAGTLAAGLAHMEAVKIAAKSQLTRT